MRSAEFGIKVFCRFIIAPANKYLSFVIPAKAGIQLYHWIPEQVRYDGFGYLDARLIIKRKSEAIRQFRIPKSTFRIFHQWRIDDE